MHCIESYGVFPPPIEGRHASVASFLYNLASCSQRPQSLLKMAWSATVQFYDAIDFDIRCKDLLNIMHALVKTFTCVPQGRTPIPDIQPIMALFRTWGQNVSLPIDRLRQKCIALLCLTAMCRPSDISPQTGFLRKQIQFNDDGSATIMFFGIKNDADRKGFEIRLAPTADPITDPINCLKTYIDRTTNNAGYDDLERPVFLSLTPPYKAIGAGSVAQILTKTLRDAGFAGKYTARSFRAAGASAAVSSGCDPDTTRQIGRWKSRDVFFEHYVYPKSGTITESIVNHN